MKRRSPSITSLVAALLIVSPIIYVLSYAPVVRMYGGGSHPDDQFLAPDDLIVGDGSLFPVFLPIDWIIDETPLRDPLLLWADLWGVRGEFEMGESIRRIADLDFELPTPEFHYVELHPAEERSILDVEFDQAPRFESYPQEEVHGPLLLQD